MIRWYRAVNGCKTSSACLQQSRACLQALQLGWVFFLSLSLLWMNEGFSMRIQVSPGKVHPTSCREPPDAPYVMSKICGALKAGVEPHTGRTGPRGTPMGAGHSVGQGAWKNTHHQPPGVPRERGSTGCLLAPR